MARQLKGKENHCNVELLKRHGSALSCTKVTHLARSMAKKIRCSTIIATYSLLFKILGIVKIRVVYYNAVLSCMWRVTLSRSAGHWRRGGAHHMVEMQLLLRAFWYGSLEEDYGTHLGNVAADVSATCMISCTHIGLQELQWLPGRMQHFSASHLKSFTSAISKSLLRLCNYPFLNYYLFFYSPSLQ